LLTQIQAEPLALRLLQQLLSAASDFANDPRGFVREIFAPNDRDRKRKQLLYGGFALGVVIYGALLTLVLVVGLKKILHVNQDSPDKLVWLPSRTGTTEELGGPGKPDARRGDSGGGGGGQNDPRPVSRGALPESAPHPPIVRANPSNILAPSLPQPTTIVGALAETASVPAPIGFTRGASGDFAPGPGDGGGMGSGKGTGVGPGTGGGAGPGSGGNRGGGDAGLPTGSGSRVMTDYDWGSVKSKPGYTSITWIRRLRAVVSQEAQKSVGEESQVWLRATFRNDATITDIEVINGIDFMTEAAIDALKRSTFRPATLNGTPITVRNVVVSVGVGPRPVHRSRID